MIPVRAPKQKVIQGKSGTDSGSFFGTGIGAALGGVVGGIYGGPSGAAAGASAGGSLGRFVGGLFDSKGEASTLAPQKTHVATRDDTAVDAKLRQLQAEDPINQLQEAIKTLPTMSPEIQNEYQDHLLNAYKTEWQRRSR